MSIGQAKFGTLMQDCDKRYFQIYGFRRFMKRHENSIIGLVLLSAFSLGWAIKDVLIKRHLATINPLVVTYLISFSAFVSVIFLRIISIKFNGRTRAIGTFKLKLSILGLAVFTAIALISSIYSINIVGPVQFTIIDSIAYPICLSILARIYFMEKINRSLLLSLLLASIGIIVFYVEDSEISGKVVAWGGGLTILSSFSYAISLVLIKNLLKSNFETLEIITIRFSIIGSIGFLGILINRHQLSLDIAIYPILIGSIGYTSLFYFLLEGLKNIPAVIVGVFAACAPLFSAIVTWLLIPNTIFTKLQLVSLGIVLISLLIPIFPHFKFKIH